MTTPTYSLTHFISSLSVSKPSTQVWSPASIERSLSNSTASQCMQCNRSSVTDRRVRLKAVRLIPDRLGGFGTSDNWMLLCGPCRRVRRIADPATLIASSQGNLWKTHVLDRRDAILLNSLNHLTGHSRHTRRHRVLAAMTERHQHPRVRMDAALVEDMGYLALSKFYGDHESQAVLAAIAKWTGKVQPVMDDQKLIVFQVNRSAFLQIVWEAIERNALVCNVGPEPGTATFEECWWITSNKVSALHHRKTARGQLIPYPAKTVEKSQKRAAQSLRKSRARATSERALIETKELRRMIDDGRKTMGVEELLDLKLRMLRVAVRASI